MAPNYDDTPKGSFEELDESLVEARKRMEEILAGNEEKLRELAALRDEQERQYHSLAARATDLERQAAEALKAGDRAGAESLLSQKLAIDPAVKSASETFQSAVSAVEAVVAGVARQRAQIEEAAFEAMLLKTQLSAVEIQNAIAKALEGMDFSATSASFDAAHGVVTSLEAENMARIEVHGDRMDVQIAAVEEAVVEESVESMLARLESEVSDDGGVVATPLIQPGFDASDEAFLASLDRTLEDLT